MMTDHVEYLGERYSHFDEDGAWGVVHWPYLPEHVQNDDDDKCDDYDNDGGGENLS